MAVDSVVVPPNFGTVSVNSDGTFTYNYTGGDVPVGGLADSFTYKLVSVAQIPGVNYEFWANNSTLNTLLGTGADGFPTTLPDYRGFSSTYNVDKAVRDYSTANGITPNFDNFVIRYSSGLTVTTGGEYTFWTGSDDGSVVFVDGQLVVNNDGLHSFTTVGSTDAGQPLMQNGGNGKIYLSPGSHSIEVRFMERGGQETLTVSYGGADTGTRKLIWAARPAYWPTNMPRRLRRFSYRRRLPRRVSLWATPCRSSTISRPRLTRTLRVRAPSAGRHRGASRATIRRPRPDKSRSLRTQPTTSFRSRTRPAATFRFPVPSI